MTSPRFEGSYLGAGAKITAAAVLECKICWHVYDPALGDESRQITAGTPFTALPNDWTCPGCGAAAEQFMVLRDTSAAPDAMDAAVARLEADFREIYSGKMRDVPLCNHSLHVQAVGFQPWGGHYLGVLIAPWFMNLVLLAGPDDNWTALEPGAKELIGFPSGSYEFIHNAREQVGGYKACSLFSPMRDFNSQMQAVDVARAVMVGLFDPAALERLEDAAQPLPKSDPAPQIAPAKLARARPLERRAFITGQV